MDDRIDRNVSWEAIGILIGMVVLVLTIVGMNIHTQSSIRATINAQIEGTNRRIDDTNRRIDDTNGRFEDTNQRIDKALDAIGDVDRRVSKVEGILETLQAGNKEDFTGLNTSIDSVHTTMRDIGRRVAELEGIFGAIVFSSPTEAENPLSNLPGENPPEPRISSPPTPSD